MRKSIGILLFFISTQLYLLHGQNLSELPILSKKTVEESVVFEDCRNINSKKVEFSPSWYKDGIVYVAEEKGKKAAFFQLYYSPIRDGMPSSRILFTIDKDTALHEGPMCFSADQNRMYFTRSNFYSGEENTDEEGKVRLQIFQADNKNGRWTNVEFLPFNDPSYSVCHPTFDVKNKRLYFASDMPGGYGNMDIYYAELIGGNWSDPVNMGSAINSKSDDAFPFYHEAGYLLFSSNRKGFGGYDFYLTTSRRHHALGALLLPPPFNSPADDLGIVMDEEAKTGFISSNRKGGKGQDDLYRFDSDLSLLDSRVSKMFTVPIKISDSLSNNPIVDGSLFLIEAVDINTIDKELLWMLLDHADEDIAEIMLDGREMKVSKFRSNDEGIVKILTPRGSSYFIAVKAGEYNRNLSKKTFVDKDDHLEIRLSRDVCHKLTFNSISLDQNKSLHPDIEIESSCDDKKVEYYAEHCFRSDCDYSLIFKQAGYESKKLEIKGSDLVEFSKSAIQIVLKPFQIPEIPSEEKIQQTEEIKEPIEIGTRIIIDNLYYAYDDAGLRPQAQKELDKIYRLMQDYPRMQIELSSHTDCRGPDNFNLKLSQERALSAKFYLLNKGIVGERIVARGLGESQLRNHCKDGVECTEEEHAINRRTEILILNIGDNIEIIRK
jgi:outer membrane protein OmpA-like peptidoglycan-associated protein